MRIGERESVEKRFPEVYAITLNWNGQVDTLQCVASLKESNYPNFRIVVVDNGSTDGSVEGLKAEHPDIAILENGRNLGYAEGFNAGMRYAVQNGADYFLVLNNDTVVDQNAMGELVRVAEQDAEIGFVSGKVYFHGDTNRLQTVGKHSHPVFLVGDHIGHNEIDVGQYDQMRECEFMDDVFLLVRRSVFEKVGGYDRNFFLMFEEADWCARVRKAGYKIVYTPKARIWHKGNKDSSSGRSPIHQFYLARNQIPFMRRNASRQQFRRFLVNLLFSYRWPFAPRQAWRLLKQGRLKLLSTYLRGIASGLLWLLRNLRVTPSYKINTSKISAHGTSGFKLNLADGKEGSPQS